MSTADYEDAYDSFEELYGRKPDPTEKYDIQKQVNRDMLTKEANKKPSFSEGDEKILKTAAKNRGKKPKDLADMEKQIKPEKKKSKPKQNKSKDTLKDVVDKRHILSVRRAFVNRKTGTYWVNGLSGNIPKNSKDYVEITGKEQMEAARIESEKYNKRQTHIKAGKKGARTKKRRERKESIVDFADKQADLDEAGKRITKTKKSSIQWFGKRKDQAKEAGAKTKAGGKWAWGKSKKAGAKTKKVTWDDRVAADRHRKHIAQPTDGISGAVRRGGQKLGSLGYALPGPIAIFTLAWTKMTKVLKILTVLVMAVAILFVPWGIFYYAGWAVGAAFMFLLSLIFWVFISMFNSIAYVLVAIINAISRIILMGIVGLVEWVTGFFTGVGAVKTASITIGDVTITRSVSANYWTQGHELMENSLISYEMISEVPSLMIIVTPEWQSWFNDSIIGHLLNMLGIKASLTFISDPFRQFYESLDPTAALMFGLLIVAIPVGFLAYVYFKNRHHFY